MCIRSFRLMFLVAKYSSLVSANAFISTLGGGHFLCKQIDASRKMAARQIEIARRLGDASLALECEVHLIYNDIQTGEFYSAKQRHDTLARAANERQVRGCAWISPGFADSLSVRCVLCVCCWVGASTGRTLASRSRCCLVILAPRGQAVPCRRGCRQR